MADRIIPIELCLSELKKHSYIQHFDLADYSPDDRFKSEVLATVHFKVEALVRLHEAKVALDCLIGQKEDPARISRMIAVLSSYNVDRVDFPEKYATVDDLLERAERALAGALLALRTVDFRPKSERGAPNPH